MQPPLHREHRQAKLLSHAAERDVEDAIKAEYEQNGLPMPWDEMAKRILALEKQLASLEDRFTALLDQGTAHEKELSAHQTALDCLRFDLDKAYMTELQGLKQLVERHAVKLAALETVIDEIGRR